MSSAVALLHPAVVGFRQAVVEQHLGLEGLHIFLNGRGELTHRWVADDRRDIYSVSKTFTSVAVGIAQAEGLLDLDDFVLRHLPQFVRDAADGVEAMTVRHLLSMTAGNGYRWLDPDADHPEDPARAFLSTALVAQPGTIYHYRGANSYMLGRIIQACSGLDLRDYLISRLFDPLQIRNPQWHRCPLGYPLGAVGLFLRTNEIARLGETLLNDGSFRGQQLIPADFVTAMTQCPVDTGREEPDNQRYGLHAWLCDRDRAWRMDGIYGQFSIMLPRHDACITVTAHYEGATTEILDAIWSELVPHLP